MRLASLPMYDADPASVSAWWGAIRRALRSQGVSGVPDEVTWPTNLDAHWRDPALLLSQTCGYPLVTRLSSVVQVVGAFHYTAPGASGMRYRSALVVRDEDAGRSLQDFGGRRVAVGALDSYSGWHALRAAVSELDAGDDFFSGRTITGSHRASLDAVRCGQADLAAIDCVTLAGLQCHAAHLLAGLSTIGFTDSAPGLPLITSRQTSATDLQAIQRSLHAVAGDAALTVVRANLFIGGFVPALLAAWDPIRSSIR